MFTYKVNTKNRTTQTFLDTDSLGPSSPFRSWILACALLSAHTLLIIATILYVCGGPTRLPETPPIHELPHGGINTSAHQGEYEALKHKEPQHVVSHVHTEHDDTVNSSREVNTEKPMSVAAEDTTTEVLTTTPKVFKGPLSSYLTKRGEIQHNLDFQFSQASQQTCGDEEVPFLLIMVLTKHYEITKRNAIRSTWGLIAKDGKWPRSKRAYPGVKLVFLLGHPPGHASKYDTAIKDEGERYGDIVQADFIDSAFNASTKILLGLEWVINYCPKTRFILRVGGDQFVHVANIVKYLESLEEPNSRVIVGHAVPRIVVSRKGAWAIGKDVYPYDKYPPYVVRNSYVISGSIARDMYSTAQYLPYVFIENAYITGILRAAVGASMLDNRGFVGAREPKPKLCGFHNDFRFTSNSSPSLTLNMWESLSRELENCYTPPKHKR